MMKEILGFWFLKFCGLLAVERGKKHFSSERVTVKTTHFKFSFRQTCWHTDRSSIVWDTRVSFQLGSATWFLQAESLFMPLSNSVTRKFCIYSSYFSWFCIYEWAPVSFERLVENVALTADLQLLTYEVIYSGLAICAYWILKQILKQKKLLINEAFCLLYSYMTKIAKIPANLDSWYLFVLTSEKV